MCQSGICDAGGLTMAPACPCCDAQECDHFDLYKDENGYTRLRFWDGDDPRYLEELKHVNPRS